MEKPIDAKRKNRKAISISRLDWTDGARTGLIMLGLGFYFIYRDTSDPSFLDSAVDWAIAISLLYGGWILIQLARTLARWKLVKKALSCPINFRSKAEWREIRRGYRELFLYLTISLVCLAVLIWSTRTESYFLWPELKASNGHGGEGRAQQSICFLAAIVLSFIPIFLGNWLKARHESIASGKELFRDDAVSPLTAYIGFAIVFLIVMLAVWAGNLESEISSTLAFYVTFGVMLMFITFILWPHVARALNNVFEHREIEGGPVANAGVHASLPASMLSYFDSFLVRLVAPLSGATQRGPLVPHALVISVLLPLIVIGFFLPSPYGLFPVFLGMIIVLALGRRWAWIEDDRETASRLLQTESREIHIGFDNDLKDEALLGYASLFLFVPLALYQIHGWLPGVFVPGEGYANDPVRDWVGFFGSELAKAVPFVDWWEIYQIDIDRPYQPAPELPAGKHLTFLARAMVDLVIMAALFQAFSIWQRGRTQHRLYDAGQLDSFDPFTEYEFFTRGMLKTKHGYRPRRKFEERIEEHIAARAILGLPSVPYNERRLSEIIGAGANNPKQKEIVAGAEWMIRSFSVLAGSPAQKIKQLVQHWEQQLKEAENTRPDFSGPELKEWRRVEKLRLETLLSEVRDAEREVIPKSLDREDIANLTRLSQCCSNAVEFQFSRLLIIETLAESQQVSAFWSLASQVGPASFFDQHQHLASKLTTTLGGSVLNFNRRPRLAHQDMRALAIDAIGEHSTNFDCDDEHLYDIITFLERIADVEASKPVERAQIVLANLRSRCSLYTS